MSLVLMGKVILIGALLRLGWGAPAALSEVINGFISGFRRGYENSTARKR